MKLSLAEGLMLIALDDEEGRLLAMAERSINHGLVTAAILELYLLKRIDLADGQVTILSEEGTGNRMLDYVMKKLGSGGASVTETVRYVTSNMREIREEVINMLISRGVIRRESTKIFWIPLAERVDNQNYAFEKEIRTALRNVVLKGTKPTPAFAMLISLVSWNELLPEVFHNKDELIDAVKTAKDIVKNSSLDPKLAAVLDELKSYFDSL